MKAVTDCFWDGKILTPGFRFHPTDEELVLYYLKRKICCKRHRLDVIGELDVYKCDPEELPGMSKLKTGDRQWFFFSPRDRKYPNAARSNRATRQGYWKATGKDRVIMCGPRAVGYKKTLVFYRGRAPSGKRTDWVMHEYTMDEGELGRCKSGKDYYALYKVYKKSGPGPKNGEQYGALFNEEEWEDDGFATEKENPATIAREALLVDNGEAVEGQHVSSLDDDLEEITKTMMDEPIPHQTLPADEVGYTLEQFTGQVGSVGNDDSCIDFPLPVMQHSNLEVASFELTQSVINGLLSFNEVSEISSTPVINVKNPHVIGENFTEDFLEMDDLSFPILTAHDTDDLVNTDPQQQVLDGFNDLSGFDFYEDVSILNEVAPVLPSEVSEPHMDNFFDSGSWNVISDSQLYHPENSRRNYLMQPEGVVYQTLTDEQCYNVVTDAEANQELLPSLSTGVWHQDQSSGFVKEKESSKEDDGTDSWFSSALWSFVESIPTTPASASESALVNRAFERMSSFSRIRINARNMNFAAGNALATTGRSGKFRASFICLSLIGVLCALLWVFVRENARMVA